MLKQTRTAVRSLLIRWAPASVLTRRARRWDAEGNWEAAEKFYRLAAVRGFRNPAYALEFASYLNRQGRNNIAHDWAAVVVDSTLRAHYNARGALAVHAPFFGERHEMAEFIVRNRSALRSRTDESIRRAGTAEGKPKVFVYWNTPHTMPAIVAAARASVRAHVGDEWELVELDDTSIGDWVELDEQIAAPLRSSPAHFSDYLRLRLLHRHGGLWIDATCLLTEDLWAATDEIRQEDAFLYRYYGSRVGNWLFWSRPDSYALNAILAVFELWWLTEARLTNYFMWHDIAEMLYWTDERYRSAWNTALAREPYAAMQMLAVLDKPFDIAEYRRMCDESFVHKLTHKLDPLALQSGTLAQRIISGDLPSD